MIALNLKTRAATQTTEAFNSMCRFGDTYLGVTNQGLFRIQGYADAGVQIPAVFKLGKTDFGTDRMKRISYVYLGLETTGALKLNVYCDGVFKKAYDVPYPGTGKQEVVVKIPDRGLIARYWEFGVESVSGCFFALYSIKILPVVLMSA